METFAALRLEIDSWRWKGVPFYIRAGKNLPVTCTEVLARLRSLRGHQGVGDFPEPSAVPDQPRDDDRHGRDGDGPGRGDERRKGGNGGQPSSPPEEMEAYERVLGDAMAGDATLFAREDYVEEAWRIVDPALKADTPIYEYEKGGWGPAEANERIAPVGGWHNPVAAEQQDSRAASQAG